MIVVKDQSYLITTRVEVGEFFGGKPEEAFIELRETTNKDMNALIRAAKKAPTKNLKKEEYEALSQAEKDERTDRNLDSNEEISKLFQSILPRLIVNHNLAKPAPTPDAEPPLMSNSEVCDLIIDRTNLYSKVVGQYLAKVVFTLAPKSAEQSDGSPGESSEGTK